jgi:phosphoglycolate phosphatase-like HAD superfamily hydrolase
MGQTERRPAVIFDMDGTLCDVVPGWDEEAALKR